MAISIPIFTAQLEKSRDATDEANIRSAYAELSAALLTNTKTSGDATLTDMGLAAPWAVTSFTDNAGIITYTFKGQGTNTAWDNLGGDYKIGNITVSGCCANANTITFTVNAGKITAIAVSKTS